MTSIPKEESNPQKKGENEKVEEDKEDKDTKTTKKLKSKFNLLEQGRLMIIGNTEEISKNLIIIGPKGSGKSSIFDKKIGYWSNNSNKICGRS